MIIPTPQKCHLTFSVTNSS